MAVCLFFKKLFLFFKCDCYVARRVFYVVFAILCRVINMEQRLKMLKIELRAVLLPMKEGASFKEMHNEYKARIGTEIPLEELGIRNTKELLDNLPDVAYMDYDNKGELRAYAVPDENTVHIHRMVAKQKVGT